MRDTTTETADQGEPLTITNEELFLELKKTRRQLLATGALVSFYAFTGAAGALGVAGLASIPYAEAILSGYLVATAAATAILTLALVAYSRGGVSRRLLFGEERTESDVREALEEAS